MSLNDINSLSHTKMELQISYSVCAKAQEKGILQRKRRGENIERIVWMKRGEDSRNKSMFRSRTYIFRDIT